MVEARARSFGEVAELYDAYRPSPPPAFATQLVPIDGRDVVEIAAGTGLVTRYLESLGARVIAIEPDPAMRAVLERRSSGTVVVEGTAEALPLDDACADLVVTSSAWHWFSQPETANEIARTLRDDGRLFILANTLNRDKAWVRDVRSLSREHWPGANHRAHEAAADLHDPFVDVEEIRIDWTWSRTPDELVKLFRTYSVAITSTEEERSRIDERVRTELARRGLGDVIDVPMTLRGVRATRRPRERAAA